MLDPALDEKLMATNFQCKWPGHADDEERLFQCRAGVPGAQQGGQGQPCGHVAPASKSPEGEENVAAFMRLAYQDIGVKQKMAEQKLRNVDLKKAEVIQRLGVLVAAPKQNARFTHFAMISSIKQEEPSGGGSRNS